MRTTLPEAESSGPHKQKAAEKAEIQHNAYMIGCDVSASTAHKKRARVALVGAGIWGTTRHLPQLLANSCCEVVAIVENRPNKVDEAKRLGASQGIQFFLTMDEMLSLKPPLQLDGVVICSPHSTHFEFGKRAVAAHLHVLMEKPMSTDAAHAAELVAAANEAGKIFMVNTTANWRDQTQIAIKMVESGQVGEVRHVQCHMASPLMSYFDNVKMGGWVSPIGKAGRNGFGWGQLVHILRCIVSKP